MKELLGPNLISWIDRKQVKVSDSSPAAEYKVLGNASFCAPLLAKLEGVNLSRFFFFGPTSPYPSLRYNPKYSYGIDIGRKNIKLSHGIPATPHAELCELHRVGTYARTNTEATNSNGPYGPAQGSTYYPTRAKGYQRIRAGPYVLIDSEFWGGWSTEAKTIFIMGYFGL